MHECAETGYYFDCNSAQLPTALEMFSQFFRSALFAPDSLDRELKSVDSEHTMNQSEDQWRLFQVCIHNQQYNSLLYYQRHFIALLHVLLPCYNVCVLSSGVAIQQASLEGTAVCRNYDYCKLALSQDLLCSTMCCSPHRTMQASAPLNRVFRCH
jgi:Insulinase (Peptidase family M16)